MSALKTVIVPIHRAGWPFIAAFAVVAALLFSLSPALGWIGLGLTGWCAYFFRDPDRVTPVGHGLVVSPADGVVSMITEAAPPPELGMGPEPLPRVSVFLNVFDVHVNRMPVDGVVRAVEYHPGAFLNASLDKASELNERNSVRVVLPDEREVAVVQIAGLVARRIICHIEPGQTVRSGERYGLIRFGSRCDVYLPKGTPPLVCVGQRMVAGETILADLYGVEPARQGEIR
ncbi:MULTISPECIES: phosphatidylserine decarboxylase [Rhodospirillales]|uniref:Phosphatidylserine decarboxylase proenzyme n=2 Tax=Rhodospirillales TaxID=204441 RepID=B6IT78_RHOCS|nr:phosphatidylserine decarboxylase [Rhodospirillum centenum]ACI98836.1 phosphatidylserine decarboxylase-like protein, putative [Rhodospirillum centenum SW]